MLDLLRKLSSSAFSWLLLGFVILVFVFFFGPSYRFLGKEKGYAAIVNGRVITLNEFKTTYSNYFRFFQQSNPDFDNEKARQLGLASQVLDTLVKNVLIVAEATKAGLRITPDELKKFILESKTFQENGHFSFDRYKKFVNYYYQTSVARFERRQRDSLLSKKFYDFVSMLVKVPESDVRESFNMSNDTATLEYVKIPGYKLTGLIKIDDKEIDDYIKSYEKELKDEYDKHKDRYIEKEAVHARHILIKLPKDATDQERKEKEDLIKSLFERAKKGEDFAELAKKYSEDPGSKNRGGDLGFFTRGRMVKPFEDLAFRLKPGEIGGPVKTTFGYHIIKVEEHRKERQKTFDEVKRQIARKKIEQQKRKNLAKKIIDAIISHSIKKDGLKTGLEWAKKSGIIPEGLNLKVEKSDQISRERQFIPGLGTSKELTDAIFSLKPKDVPEVLNKPFKIFGSYVAIRVVSRQLPDDNIYNTVKDATRSRLEEKRANSILSDYVEMLKKGANIETNIKVLNPSTE